MSIMPERHVKSTADIHPRLADGTTDTNHTVHLESSDFMRIFKLCLSDKPPLYLDKDELLEAIRRVTA